MQLKVQKFRNPSTGARAGQTKSPSNQEAQGWPGRTLISTVPAQLSCFQSPASQLQRHQHFLSYSHFESLLAVLTAEFPGLRQGRGSVDFCADLGNFYSSFRAFGVKLLTEAGNMTTMCFLPREGQSAALRCISCSCRWLMPLALFTPCCWQKELISSCSREIIILQSNKQHFAYQNAVNGNFHHLLSLIYLQRSGNRFCSCFLWNKMNQYISTLIYAELRVIKQQW